MAMLDGEYQRNTPPEPQEPEFVCAQATGCEFAQDGECNFVQAHRRDDIDDVFECPNTGKAVGWREL